MGRSQGVLYSLYRNTCYFCNYYSNSECPAYSDFNLVTGDKWYSPAGCSCQYDPSDKQQKDNGQLCKQTSAEHYRLECCYYSDGIIPDASYLPLLNDYKPIQLIHRPFTIHERSCNNFCRDPEPHVLSVYGSRYM